MKNYRRKLLDMRYRKYPFEKEIVSTMQATKYFGYQISHTIVGWVLIYIFLLLLVIFGTIFFHFKSVREQMALVIVPAVVAYVVTNVPIRLIIFFFITKNEEGMQIKSKPCFKILDLFNFFLQVMIGTLGALGRFATFFIVLIFTFNRLDFSVFPKQFYFLDAGCNAFDGMLLLDHYYNNPVLLIFSKIVNEKILPKFQEESGATNNIDLKNKEISKSLLAHKIRTAILLNENPSLQRFTKVALERKRIQNQHNVSRVAKIYESDNRIDIIQKSVKMEWELIKQNIQIVT